MKLVRRILRTLFYLVLIAVAGAAGALIVLTETERGRDNLAGIISTLASSPDRKVTISGINGIWSGALTADHVVVEDREGPWLVLRNVAVDWSPTALLSKRFSADRVAAERIEVARQPVASTAPAEQSGETTLPVSIDIKEIDLPEIALGEKLAGTDIAELAAKGSLRAESAPLVIETDLDISRSDGRQGKVLASVHFAPADNKLDLDVKASEPAGGIIANLLKLPGAPPVDIVVSGNGPIADWSGTGTFSVAGKVVTQLSGRHQLTTQGNRIEAKGDGEFERFVPESLKPLLAGKTSFDVAGTATRAGGVDIERADITGDAVHGTAAGTVNPQGASDLSVELAANGPPVVLSVGSQAQPITVAIDKATVRAFGDGRTPMVDIGASLVSVVAGGTSVRELQGLIHSDGFDIQNRSGPLEIKLTAAALDTDVATLAPLVTGRLSADFAGTVSKDAIVVDHGTLLSDALNASVTANVVLADLSMTLSARADAASAALPAQIRTVLGERVRFSATASRDADGAFAANSLELTSGSLSASGTARAQGTDIVADLKGSLADVSVLSPLVGVDIGGGVSFALTASGARTAPDFTVSATSDRLTASGRDISGIMLDASGKADIAAPAADVSLTGTAGDQPFSLKAALDTADGRRSINGISLSLGDSRLSGDLVLGDAFLPTGTLTLDMPDIAPLAALANQQAAGDVHGTIRLAAEGDVPSVAVEATSKSIARGDLSAKAISVDVVIANYIKAPAVSGTVKADTVTSGRTVVSGIAVDLKQDGDWTGFSGGATVAGIPATAVGRVNLAGGTTTVELASGEATVRGIKAAIAEASSLTIASGEANIRKLALDVGGGSVNVSGTAGQNLDLVADFSALPAALANGFVEGLAAAGTLSGTARVTGPSADPSVRFDVHLAGAETAQTRKAKSGPLDVDAAGTYSPSTGIMLDQAAISGDGLSGSASGTLKPNGAGDFVLDLNAVLASLPMALANAYVPGVDATGSLSGKVEIGALASNPSVRFDARIAGVETSQTRQARLGPLDLAASGSYSPLNGVSIDNLALTGEEISGKATGTINPNGASDFALDLASTGASLPLSLGGADNPIDIAVQSLSLRAAGESATTKIDLSAMLPSVTTKAASLTGLGLSLHSDAFDIKGRTGPVSIKATAERIGLDNPTVAPLIAGKVTADVAGTVAKDAIAIESGSIASDALNGDFSGRVSLADGSVALDVRADADSAALPAGAHGVLGERTTLSASLERDSGGNITAKAMNLASGSLSAGGDASLAGGKVDANIKGVLGDVSLLSKEAAGAIAFALTAAGPRTAPDVSLTVNSDTLKVASRDITGLELKVTGKADMVNPTADLSLSGSVAGQDLQGSAALITQDGKHAIERLALSLGENRISGDLALDDAFVPEGTISLELPDIGPLAALALERAEGSVTGTIRFSKAGGTPIVAVDVKSPSLSRGDLSAKMVGINAAISDYLLAPVISGMVTADSVISGTTAINGIGIDLKQDGEWTGFSGGATIAGIPATAAGRVRIANGVTTVELASGEATFRGIKAAIAGASSLTVANGATNIQKLVLDVGGGTVNVSGAAGQTLDLAAEFSALPAALANGFVEGLDAAGILSGTAHVQGSTADPAVRFDAHLANAETSQTRQRGLGPLDLDAAGAYSSASGVVLDQATLTGEKISGKASGTVNPNGASDFSLDLASTGPSLPASLGSAESPIDLEFQAVSLKAAGQGTSAKLDISASLPSAATKFAKGEGIKLSLHSDGFDVKGRTGPFSGTVTADKVDLDNPTVAPLVAGKVTAAIAGSLSADAVVVDSASVRSDTLNGSLDGRVSLAGGAIDLNVKADAASAALPAAARSVLGDRTAISAALKRDDKGDVTADSVTLASGALTASGDASLAEGKVAANVKGALADVSLLSKDATGAIAFALTANGEMATPDLSLTVDSDGLTVAAREITGLKLTATGKADLANPAANVSLAGNVAGQELQGSAVLKTSQGMRAINGLSLSLGSNKISGDLVLDDAFLPVGTVSLDLPDIGPLAALALEKAEGDVRGTIRFSKKGEAPQVAIDATTASVTRGDLSAKKVSVNALIADYLQSPMISGKIRADSVTSGGTVITGIDIDLTRDGEWTGFSGGATVKDIPAKAAGRVKISGGTTTVELSSGQATVRGIKAAIAHASTITIANGTTTLDKLALNLGGGTATVSGTAGQSLKLDATLAGVPLSIANSFSPGLDAAGSVSGTVKVTGAAASPAVAFNIDATGVQTTQTRGAGFGSMSVSSSGNFSGGKLTFDAAIGEGSGLSLKGGGTVTVAGTPNLSLKFSGSAPFGFLAQKLAAQGLSLTGTANVDLQVSGPASAPVIAGKISTAGARFIDSRSGIAVNDIAADVALGNGVATISRLTGTLSTRGSLSVGGTVGIDPAKGFPADLSVKLVDGRYTDGKVVTANLSGDLTIKGPLVSAPVISGTINLAKTVITVPEKLPGSLAALDVKHKNAPAAVRAQDKALRPATTGGGGGSGLNLDVTVNAPNQIFIQGRGVDAELGGSLKLTGPVSSPQAVGSFKLNRGRLSILAKRLTFTEGTLTFSGSLVPYLNLTATSTANDATVTIVVSGEATSPKFTFSSVPALPEDEVLARLIFGRSMSNLSPLQIAQLAEAAGQLAGVGGSTSLLENLRGQLGVDDLDITTDESGGTSVSAGKYLNDRTYVTIQKGEKPGSGKAAIDLDVGRGLKLRGEATDAGEAKGGIFYEKEY